MRADIILVAALTSRSLSNQRSCKLCNPDLVLDRLPSRQPPTFTPAKSSANPVPEHSPASN
jgi:hypothetical protein